VRIRSHAIGPAGCRSVLLVLVLAGCADSLAPRWIDLSRAAVSDAAVLHEIALEHGRSARLVREGDDQWLALTLERASWRAAEVPGRFRAELEILAVAEPRARFAPYRLESAGRSFAYEADAERMGEQRDRFTTSMLDLWLQLGPGEEPPETCQLMACANYQSAGEGGLRIAGRRLSGAGFWVPPGATRTLELALPPASSLRFATAVEAALGGRAARREARIFRVRLDGALVFEFEQQGNVLGESIVRHEVELPRGGVPRARLSFETEGAFALTSFLGPTVGPSAIGRYGERPWREERPDLVVFLADTFRADNLTAYGGPSGLTPNLDRLAAEGRTFLRAWSTSTHTLPAHSSLFSGVYPHQNGQVDYSNPLPAAVETLAEILAVQGYRCAALTDGVMVSRSHGLDQGFESFDERREEGTVERVRAVLDADDGRPLFLFVQTYAVHAPYESRVETRRRLSPELGPEPSYADLVRALERIPSAAETPPTAAEERESVARLRRLYLAAVADLDEVFGRFRAELEARALFASGTLVFTSDHGEAFFEHGRPFHAGRVFEEELRVPLVLFGQGVTPGRDERPVSLIDFAPTLAELAGFAPRSHWEGRSLFAPDPARAIYAFQSRRVEPLTTLAVIDGARKLIGFEDQAALRADRWHAAFDLERDPSERENLFGRADWPAELADRERARLLQLLTPLVAPESFNPTGDELRQLDAMGYGGD